MGADIKHFALEQKDDNTYGWPWNEVVRKSTEPDKPYFTMEWNNNHIIQCRGSHNCGMPPEVEAFVKAFEKKMQDTINENKEKEMRRCG